MKKTVLGVVWLVAFGFGAAADEPKTEEVKKKAVDKALETFSGTWEIVAAKPEGIMKEARKLVFRKDLTYAALDKDGTELWAGTFNLDPTATPKAWDHRSNERDREERRRRLGDLRVEWRHTQGVLRGRYVEGEAMGGQASADRVQVAGGGYCARTATHQDREVRNPAP